ncbi:hypothetical protein AGMMS49974_02800 [Deltaproteobacteria bacterium]|nr:hypothetical protein AGMMS49974_02800 [Deltaproteobacteria bacterium]
MQVRYSIPLLFVLMLPLSACLPETDGAKPRFAVVDMQRIMRDAVPAKAGVAFLEEIHSGMQKKISAIQDRLEKNSKDEAAQKELQSVYMASQQRMQAEQQNVINLLDDAIQRVLSVYREQHGYDVILNAEIAAAYNPAVNVTTAVIVEVNKQKIEFKPVTAEGKNPAGETKPEMKNQAQDEGNAASGGASETKPKMENQTQDKDRRKINSPVENQKKKQDKGRRKANSPADADKK